MGAQGRAHRGRLDGCAAPAGRVEESHWTQWGTAGPGVVEAATACLRSQVVVRGAPSDALRLAQKEEKFYHHLKKQALLAAPGANFTSINADERAEILLLCVIPNFRLPLQIT
ncbi:hypothetical protein NDU88_003780 [Pleurodeles waltl]|uniref:Uncharacterized protein n=1 Tax=Pleurodeles waltl TaxID=8319 RepID=A0AAV7W5L1_PLEWA|nr:hypothetical protein NDU88_003780 [Pleurodeles waltl]